MKNTSGLIRWSIDARYNIYRQKYMEKQDELDRRYGLEMYDNMLSKAEYKTLYESIKNEKIAEGRALGNINRDIIDKQAYEYSFKQARAYAKALGKELGGESVSPYKVRQGDYEGELEGLYGSIKETYHDAKRRGMSTAEAKKYISQTYFGSPD